MVAGKEAVPGRLSTQGRWISASLLVLAACALIVSAYSQEAVVIGLGGRGGTTPFDPQSASIRYLALVPAYAGLVVAGLALSGAFRRRVIAVGGAFVAIPAAALAIRMLVAMSQPPFAGTAIARYAPPSVSVRVDVGGVALIAGAVLATLALGTALLDRRVLR